MRLRAGEVGTVCDRPGSAGLAERPSIHNFVPAVSVGDPESWLDILIMAVETPYLPAMDCSVSPGRTV